MDGRKREHVQERVHNLAIIFLQKDGLIFVRITVEDTRERKTRTRNDHRITVKNVPPIVMYRQYTASANAASGEQGREQTNRFTRAATCYSGNALKNAKLKKFHLLFCTDFLLWNISLLWWSSSASPDFIANCFEDLKLLRSLGLFLAKEKVVSKIRELCQGP